MNITLKFAVDDWGRASLATAVHTDEPSRLLIFVEFANELWWAKSPGADTDHEYSVLYHHVDDGERRQVIVACGTGIQDCVIPKGYDPGASQVATIAPFVPNIIYSRGCHALGMILLPKSATRSMRNGIWQLKDSFYTSALMPFADALSHGRTGYFTRQSLLKPGAAGKEPGR